MRRAFAGEPPARRAAGRACGGLVAHGLVGRVGEVFLGILDLAAMVATSRSSTGTALSASTVRPCGDTSAKPPNTTTRRALPDSKIVRIPGLQRRDQRRMIGEHAELPFGARDVDLIDLAGEQQLLGRDEIEVKGSHGSDDRRQTARTDDAQACFMISVLDLYPSSVICRLSSVPPLSSVSRRLGGQALALLDRLLDGADHVEGGLRQVVVLAFAPAP